MKVKKSGNSLRIEKITRLSGFKEADRLVEGERRINCPIDHTTLLKLKVEDVTIDFCPVCRGIWLDKNELNRLLVKRIKKPEVMEKITPDEEADRQSKKCPSCGRMLYKEEKKGITLDICGSCKGIWFDGGEFEELYSKHQSDGDALQAMNALAAHIIDIYV